MTLRELHKGQSATILSVGGEGALRQHFLDMGMIPGTQVTLQKFAPLGDPMELRIHGYELTLRLADAEKIIIEPPDQTHPQPLPCREGSDYLFSKRTICSSPYKGEVGRGLEVLMLKDYIPASARKAVIMMKMHFIPFHRQKRGRSPLPSWAIRTAERPLCSTN